MWKKIHVELEFLRLEFHLLLFPSPVLLLLPLFFFPSAHDSSSSNLRSPALDSSLSDLHSPERFLDLVLLLLLPLFCFFLFLVLHLHCHLCSSSSLELKSLRLEYLSISATRTRVLEAWFFHRTRATQAQDVIFLISFKFLLTNYILWQTAAILQITSSKNS